MDAFFFFCEVVVRTFSRYAMQKQFDHFPCGARERKILLLEFAEVAFEYLIESATTANNRIKKKGIYIAERT